MRSLVSILVLISQRIRKKNNQIVAALHHLDVAKTKKLKLMRRDSHRLFLLSETESIDNRWMNIYTIYRRTSMYGGMKDGL